MKGNIHEFPDIEIIEQQASAWLVRLDSEKPLTAEELVALRAWMQTSPAHREELMALSEFWGDQSLVALPIPLEQLCYQPPKANNAASGLLSAWFRPPGLALAMVLLLAISVVLGSGQWLSFSDNSNALYATAIGQQRTLKLPDGTVVFLNTNSQIKVDYSQAYRSINLLQGEAHFEVAKQPDRPFRVYAGRGRVQAVGTAFTVYYRQNDDIDVAVTEGTVALAVLAEQERVSNTNTAPPQVTEPLAETPPDREYRLAIPVDELGLLEAGQATTMLVAQASAAESGGQLDRVKTLAQEELARRGAWRSGLLVFSGNSLEEVVAEISRYTTLSIKIVDPALNKVRIGGRFSINNTEALFDALEANFGLTITQRGYNRIEISSVSATPNSSAGKYQ